MKHFSSVTKPVYQALLRENPVDSAKIDEKFQRLAQNSPQNITSFLNWLTDWNTFMGEIQDAQNLYYFQYLITLDQPEGLQAYQAFLQNCQQLSAHWEPQLYSVLEAEEPWFSELPAVFQQIIKTKLRQRQLQNKDTEPSRIALQQTAGRHPQRFMAARIEYGGKKVSPQEIALIMKRADRSGREVAWHATNAARRSDVPFFQELFEEQLQLRNQLAEATGKASFIAFRFDELGRDYAPQDCQNFHRQMAACLPDIQSRFFVLHKQSMGWDEIYPWDLAKGPEAPTPSAEQEQELLVQLNNFFQKLHPGWRAAFEQMVESDRLDLMRREHKTMGAMTYPMKADGLPLLLASYDGSAQGLTQVIHELGHAIHFSLSHNQSLLALMPIPPELGELVALTFELIALSHADCFFAEEEAQQQLIQTQLYRVFSLLSLSVAMDAFQHEVYQNPAMTPEDRNACWQQQYLRFHGDAVTWHPFEEELSLGWLKHYHLFEAPLYSIEYAIAQLGALQLWQQYLREPEFTLEKLHHVMEQGYSKSVGELYGELGLEVFPGGEIAKDLLEACLGYFPRI